MLDNECKCGRGLIINEQIGLCKECLEGKMSEDMNDLMNAEGRTTGNSGLLPVDIVKDALWWVQDGLDNADIDTEAYLRTTKCRDALEEYIESRLFCNDDCRFLSITEDEQNKQKDKKDPHICEKYKKRVTHRYAHPKLFRLMGCTEE